VQATGHDQCVGQHGRRRWQRGVLDDDGLVDHHSVRHIEKGPPVKKAACMAVNRSRSARASVKSSGSISSRCSRRQRGVAPGSPREQRRNRVEL